jgi:predicted transcriptional regulator
MKDTKQIERLEKMFKLLANKHRLAIIKLLKKESDLPVWYISDKLGSNVKTVSKHLRILLLGGVIERGQYLNEAVYYISERNPRILRYIIKQI